MEMIIVVSVVLITVAVVLVTFFAYLRNMKRQQAFPQLDISDLEERVLELVNRFQHISATRINTFELKIKEMNQLIQQANEYYMRLTSVISEAYKVESELLERSRKKDMENLFEKPQKQKEETENVVEYAGPPVLEKKEPFSPVPRETVDLQTSSIEHQILNLSSEGQSAEDIAETLQIGRGEVQLVLELFRRKNK
ncbi:MAG: hypothetical protein KBC39_07550 [Thermotogae bacterium]|nr:hypothetical protein [Thermotogota bacterium]HOZ10975.1 hypothetical protein [Thermotogota bacterium]